LPDWSDRRSSELAADGRPVAAPFNRPVSANIFSGIVIGAVNLGRGRFAMIETLGGDGGLGFSSCCGSLSSANASPGSCVTAVASTGILDRNDPLDCDCRICCRSQGEPPNVVPQRTAGRNRPAGGMNRSAWLWCHRSIAGIPGQHQHSRDGA
jgi:hypothetical protein